LLEKDGTVLKMKTGAVLKMADFDFFSKIFLPASRA